MSDNNDDEGSSVTKRKRRRKVEATSTPPSSPPSQPLIELRPRDDAPVKLEVMDIRQVVGGGGAPSQDYSVPFTNSQSTSRATSTTTTTTPSISTPSTMSTIRPSSSSSMDDSLQQLLEDARRMQQESNDSTTGSNDEGNVKTTIRNALSTLVTADFFVVCGFLLWFLVGIFCSSVLKDDTIQIAFNSNFQAFVQPALGILMIASVAGNFFKEDEDEQGI